MTQEETDELINLFFNPTLKQENEELKERIHDLLLDNTEYKLENERLNNIINKAIEYIKENACYGIQEKCCLDDLNYNECDKLLEILKGEEQ